MKYSKATEIAKYSDEEIKKARIITNQIFPKYIKIILGENHDIISALYPSENANSADFEVLLRSKTEELVLQIYNKWLPHIGIHVADGMEPNDLIKLDWMKSENIENGLHYGPLYLTPQGEKIGKNLVTLLEAL